MVKSYIRSFVFLGLFLTLLGANEATAQKAKKWKEVNHLSIVVNEEVDKSARFFLRDDRTFLLILSSFFEDALLINVKQAIVTSLNRAEINFEDDESTAITSENLQVQFLTNYTLDGSDLKFKLQNVDVRIIPRRHLIGEITEDEIFNHTPTYKRLMNQYQPESQAFQFLSQYDKPIDIVIAFGTWCAHCKKWVSKLMKAISDCKNDNLNCTYIGISRKFDQPREFLKKNKVKNIPSVIVFENGQEIGRIIGDPEVSMEADLVAILKGNYEVKEN